MKVLRFFHELKHLETPSAVAIGNFDGMHLGHQAILKNIQDQAKARGWASVVILFEPHPKEYFVPNLSPPRLMRLEDKLLFLAKMGMDIVVCLRFNEELANLSATHFVEKILIDKLKIGYLSVGSDFHFGHQRQGNVQFLRQAAIVNHFELVTQTAVIAEHGETRISSTEIRALINQSKLEEARKLLGHPITLSGRVVRGSMRGRSLGFPTANISLRRHMAYSGVFAVRVKLGEETYPGVANIGTRPTVNGHSRFLETFLFDFSGNLYGQRLCVELFAKIREEVRFESLDALRAQIEKDILEAKKLL